MQASQDVRRINRRYPFFRRLSATVSVLALTSRLYALMRRLSVTTCILTLIWLCTIYHGERSTFASHIQACHWERWEEWPAEAVPHRLVLVADPQLVDPHTYPGRPWPLSSLTEIYTDMYMSRNFRLINQKLDPDSVTFLGDMFDGGREWATSPARALDQNQRQVLTKFGLLPEGGKEREPIKFIHGERGRWSKWDDKQWKTDYDRFGKIFLSPDQIYPSADRRLLPSGYVTTHPVNLENGAKSLTSQEYAVVGTKQRRIMTSLPGNHDLGFGATVQKPVRARFQAHFGDPNKIYVLGNHTFVSVDVASLSAFDEYIPEGGEVAPERRAQYSDIWKPTHDFLDDLSSTGPRVVSEHLSSYFPESHPSTRLSHQAINIHDTSRAQNTPVPSKIEPQLPVVLLSHVPLYRNPDTDCGKFREKGKAISIARGYQYQNVLTPTISTMLAKKVSLAGEIQHIFSGDDHDYCEVSHHFNVGRWDEDRQKETIIMRTVRDTTVKTFSWAMGVRRPGFLLVSLWNPVDQMGQTIGTPIPTIQTQLCLLPDQLGLFISYSKLLGLTLIILLVRAVVVGLRDSPNNVDYESNSSLPQLSLPRYQDRAEMTATANGYASPTQLTASSQERQRASSTTNWAVIDSNNSLGVHRNCGARTRNLSPDDIDNDMEHDPNSSVYALPNSPQHTGLLIEKAGYYPQLRWQDPGDSDEESHIGHEQQDSQAKGRKRRHIPSKARRMLAKFLVSLALVGLPNVLFYGLLIMLG